MDSTSPEVTHASDGHGGKPFGSWPLSRLRTLLWPVFSPDRMISYALIARFPPSFAHCRGPSDDSPFNQPQPYCGLGARPFCATSKLYLSLGLDLRQGEFEVRVKSHLFPVKYRKFLPMQYCNLAGITFITRNYTPQPLLPSGLRGITFQIKVNLLL